MIKKIIKNIKAIFYVGLFSYIVITIIYGIIRLAVNTINFLENMFY